MTETCTCTFDSPVAQRQSRGIRDDGVRCCIYCRLPLPTPETCTCSDRRDSFTIEDVLLIINHMRDIQKYCYDCDLALPLPTLETGVAGNGGDL